MYHEPVLYLCICINQFEVNLKLCQYNFFHIVRKVNQERGQKRSKLKEIQILVARETNKHWCHTNGDRAISAGFVKASLVTKAKPARCETKEVIMKFKHRQNNQLPKLSSFHTSCEFKLDINFEVTNSQWKIRNVSVFNSCKTFGAKIAMWRQNSLCIRTRRKYELGSIRTTAFRNLALLWPFCCCHGLLFGDWNSKWQHVWHATYIFHHKASDNKHFMDSILKRLHESHF